MANCSYAQSRLNNVDALEVLIEFGADLTKKWKSPWAKGLNCLEIVEQEKSRETLALLKKHMD